MDLRTASQRSDSVLRGDDVRCLKRNQKSFWYALYLDEVEQTDSDGLYTGEIGPGYETPVQMKANISASKGTADTELFGKDLQYSRTIVTDDLACPITEESAIWIGREPKDENKNAIPHNYVVKGIAESLNHIIYAVAEAEQSGVIPTPTPTPPGPTGATGATGDTGAADTVNPDDPEYGGD